RGRRLGQAQRVADLTPVVAMEPFGGIHAAELPQHAAKFGCPWARKRSVMPAVSRNARQPRCLRSRMNEEKAHGTPDRSKLASLPASARARILSIRLRRDRALVAIVAAAAGAPRHRCVTSGPFGAPRPPKTWPDARGAL